MFKTKSDIIQKIHLIISVLIVVPVGLMYAFSPDFQFDLHPRTTDEFNVYKAIMGLYLGCSVIWVLGVFKTSYLKTALITNAMFMLSLGLGRLLSFIIDGTPSLGYQLGMLAELGLGIYGLWVLKNYKNQP